MSDVPAQGDERSVLDLICGIKDGTVDPARFEHEERQACVAHLSGEGYLGPEIAQILRVSERTIRRDRSAIRDAASLGHDPALVERIAGQLTTEADLCIGRIRRAIRDRQTPAATRIEGERACFQILIRLVDRLQSLGFLPTAAQRVSAELTHHIAPLPDLKTLLSQIEDLQETRREYGGAGDELQGQLQNLHGVSRLLLVGQQGAVEQSSDDT